MRLYYVLTEKADYGDPDVLFYWAESRQHAKAQFMSTHVDQPVYAVYLVPDVSFVSKGSDGKYSLALGDVQEINL